MLRAARQGRASAGRGQIAVVASVPSPTGGLNARDGLTQMAPTDAVILDNWFPEAQACVMRGGSATWATGLGGPVQTLLTWRSPAGADRLFGAAGASIFNATSSGAVGAAVVAGLASPQFQWTNVTTAGGSFLIACNGTDAVYSYNGAAWANPAIGGVASASLINVILFKQRLWFVEKNTLTVWYLAAGAIAGTATAFPLGGVFRAGGSVAAMGTFSQGDTGDGPDDFLAIVTTNGEIAVYQGTDPISSDTFGLVGIYTVGKPIGRRCMVRLNGDLGILTYDGLISMQAALQFDRASDQKATITGKIQTLFSAATAQYGTAFGWQAFLYPKARYVIVNYPVVASSQQAQFVMNTVTGAWCTFSGLNASCWGQANDQLFFGGNNGTILEANILHSDSGGDILGDMQCAFRDFDIQQKKMITAVKPILATGGGVQYQQVINWDFDSTPPSGTVSASPISGAVWGSMTWPWTWGGNGMIDARWRAAGGVGTWAAIRFRAATNGAAAQVNAFNVLIQQGGPF